MGFDDSFADSSVPSEKRQCGGVQCELVEYESLPEYLKDNEFILGYYRCEWPLRQTILSVFSVHNETRNVWTHLIGFLIFLSLTVITAIVIPRDTGILPTATAMATTTDPLTEVMACLPSQLNEEILQSTFPAADVQPWLSDWNLSQLLVNCLPKGFSGGADNLTNPCAPLNVEDDAVKMAPPVPAKPITRWPFFAFLGGAMLCLLTSSICHLILCHSERTAYIMLRLDYAGITALIVTSFYPLVFYTFMCDPFFRNLYVGFITAFGAATVSASLVPMFQTAEFRVARSALFFCMGVSGVVPIMHKLVAFGNRPEAILSAGYELLMGCFYGLGVVVYTTRVPERWMPGRFDLVGHSHQLFHVLVIAGAYTHYLAGLVYLQWRDIEGC